MPTAMPVNRLLTDIAARRNRPSMPPKRWWPATRQTP
jgi:hypothetical protein